MYLDIFVNNIVPIFLMAGTGYALGRRFQLEVKTASRLAFYVFSPCLVFTSIVHTQLTSAEFGQMAGLTLAVTAGVALLALAAGLALRLERRLLSALIVASVFGNAGNYGLAVNKFAFGDEAVARAVVYYVFSTLAVYTLGVIVSSLGHRPVRQALAQVLGVPAAYGLALGGVFRATGWQVPLPADRALTILSQAAIPIMIVILGIQMAEVRAWPRGHLGLIAVASGLQLVAAPALGLLLAGPLGLTGVTRQAALLEAAMPAAVITTILAVEYDLDAAFVTGVVVFSTLLSPLTLTPWIAYLQ